MAKAIQELLDTGEFGRVMGVTLTMAEELVSSFAKSRGEDMDGQDITLNAPSGRLITFHKMSTTFDDEMTH